MFVPPETILYVIRRYKYTTDPPLKRALTKQGVLSRDQDANLRENSLNAFGALTKGDFSNMDRIMW